MNLSEIVQYLDEYLDVANVPDFPGAYNGLQVEGRREVKKVAVAVDAAYASLRQAVTEGADVVLVHHGLFWDGQPAVTGRRYRRLRTLMEADVALYASHLPLDVHPEVGNNAVLARRLGIEVKGRFAEYQGTPLGVWGELEIRREALAARLDQILGGRVKLIAGGPERVRTVGVITGGAGSEILSAQEAGLDAYVTGEGAHHNFFDAVEGGINLYLGGHYATEVWGVQALGEHLARKFGLEWFFVDQPTGL